MNYSIIEFSEKYRDDLIFMILEAKDALGKTPTINEDLLDIAACYFDKGDMFWIAVDEKDRVIGSVGFNSVAGTDDVWLHRLYVKAALKRQGIGTALLRFAEKALQSAGKHTIFIHLGGEEYFESRQFYPANGYEYYEERYMKKKL